MTPQEQDIEIIQVYLTVEFSEHPRLTLAEAKYIPRRSVFFLVHKSGLNVYYLASVVSG